MRRGMLLAGLWLLATVVAVTFSFVAVGRVASGVSRSNVALSGRVIDRDLRPAATKPRTTAGTRPPTSPSSVPHGEPTSTTLPSVFVSPSASVPTSTVPRTFTSSPTTSPPTARAFDTVTTSQGGTIWTRCSGPDSIVFVSAIPKSGYERIIDVESSAGIDQQFENGSRRSKIQAACSNGVVHAEVEEESAGD